jgi:hypothetical protein
LFCTEEKQKGTGSNNDTWSDGNKKEDKFLNFMDLPDYRLIFTGKSLTTRRWMSGFAKSFAKWLASGKI